jgi:hypothetical protein
MLAEYHRAIAFGQPHALLFSHFKKNSAYELRNKTIAKELMSLPNPDNMPGAISSDYPRQNTNIFALQTGLDTTEPVDNDNGTITIPAGGLVELNGVIFKLPRACSDQKK